MAEVVEVDGQVVVMIDGGDVQHGLVRRMIEVLEDLALTGTGVEVVSFADAEGPPTVEMGWLEAPIMSDCVCPEARLPPPERPWQDQRRCRPRKLRRWGPRRRRR